MSARFLIAKYVPDVKRMEPRNIGVITWCDGCADARFLGEDEKPPRRLGVRDTVIYRKWLTSWRKQIAKPFVEIGHGQIVNKSTPDFLDALCEWSRDSFLLVDGGEIIDTADRSDLSSVTEYLFRELVAEGDTKEAREHEYQRLKTAVSQLVRQSGLSERSGFRRDEPTWYKAFGLTRSFPCDYVLGPMESPYSIYHRAILTHQKTFDSTAFHLHWFRDSRHYPRERCAAFVVGSRQPTREQVENRQMLDQIATVIDVTDTDAARTKLGEIASLNGHP